MSSEPPEGVVPPASATEGDGPRVPRPAASDGPPSSSTARRRSRRTVKIPNDAVPESAPAEVPAGQMQSTLVGVAAVTDGVTPKPPAALDGAPPRVEPPLQVIPQAPPVPRAAPAIPRPSPKTPPAPAPAPVPAAAPPAAATDAVVAPRNGATPAEAGPAPPPPSPQDDGDVIRPMRIISIGTSSPSPTTPPPPSAPPAAAAPPQVAVASAPPAAPDGRVAQPSVDAAWDDMSDKRVSRPPMNASPEIAAAPPPPESRPSKPSVIEEIDEVEEVAPPPVPKPPKPPPIKAKAPTVEELDAIEAVEEHVAEAAPRGAKTDEIEPIPLDEIEDRISETDLPVDVEVDLDSLQPKKPPPPPPPKRPAGAEPGAPSAAAPRGDSPPPAPPAAAAPPPPPPVAAVAPAAAVAPPPPPVVAPAAPPPPPPAAPPPPVVAAAPPPPPPAVAPAAPPGPPPPPPAAAAPVVSSAGPPPSTPTIDLSGKKRVKPWWEEIFSDDYIRTLERVDPRVIRKECDFIEDRLGLEKGAVMLDLACGEGSHAVELASRGYKVVGFDLSLAMLARAQDEALERGQKINFLQGDMREMVFEGAFDGIFSWSTSFGYFDDEKNVNVLSRVHRSLRQGGMFLLDVINRDYVCPRQPSLVWFEGDGCVCMDEMHVDFFTSRLRVKRTVMFEDGRARECDYSIRLYGLHELGRMLHDTGFKVVEVTGHPAHPGVFFGSESPRIIVLAERA